MTVGRDFVFTSMLMMIFCGGALGETGIDPASSEGQAKIASFKAAYVAQCTDKIGQQMDLGQSPLKTAFAEAFRAACLCGVERGLATFTPHDYSTIELLLDNPSATSRLDNAVLECSDAAAQSLQNQQ